MCHQLTGERKQKKIERESIMDSLVIFVPFMFHYHSEWKQVPSSRHKQAYIISSDAQQVHRKEKMLKLH